MTHYSHNFANRGIPIDYTGDFTPDTGALTPSIGGTAYAFRVGTAMRDLAAIDAFFYVHGVVAVGSGWAELAIATSAQLAHANFDSASEAIALTYRGYADIATEVKIASTTGYWKRIVPSTPIAAGSPLWLVVSNLFATTQASFRTFNQGVVVGDAKSLADAAGTTTRPSTNIGVARTFTGNVGSVVNSPFLRARDLG